ncbi:MAG: FHA domain-containing protein, partial [Bacteroidia bacterium]|nr:FHA domain-containing protein [Bacteroidia bacterium]
NSKNGTFVNDVRNETAIPVKLSPADKINLANDITIEIKLPEKKHDFKTMAIFPADSEKSPLMGIGRLLKSQKTVTIGTDPTCDIVIDPSKTMVSLKHVTIIKQPDETFILKDTSSTGTYVNGKLITGSVLVTGTDTITIGEDTFTIGGFHHTTTKKYSLSDKLEGKQHIIIGRDPSCEVVLEDLRISRKHAEVYRKDGNIWVRDLGSTNGTFLNGNLLKTDEKLNDDDTLIIGLYSFKFNEEVRDLNLELAVRIERLEKTFDNHYQALKEITLSIPYKAFIAIMGPSGCGKTTFMNALNGQSPATGGKVYIHGLELTSNYNLLKRKMGYVPQQDIVHSELTVRQSLYFAAKLRMPDNTSEEEIKVRIDEVLASLKINDPKISLTKVGDLSGGQRKRVSIAVELLTRPTILFLDEPTSPLDPETIEEFLTCIRELAENGTTVIMVTHKPEDLNYVDRVIFLGQDGYHAYYGDKKELLEYFHASNIISVYATLSYNEIKGETEEKVKKWYNKWYEGHTEPIGKEEPSKIKKERQESLFRQFYWLMIRYFRIKMNNKGNLLLLIAQPVIIALLLIFIFDSLKLGVLFLMAISAVWFGVSNASKEIVGELPVYKRERMFNVNIFTYLFSKITVLSFIALAQVIIFIFIVYLRYMNDTIHLVYIPQYIGFMFYLVFSATLLGLLLSAIFDNSEKVMTLMPIILIPQIMLAGTITRIDTRFKEVISYFTLGRWGIEGFARLQDKYPSYQIHEKLLTHLRVTDTTYSEQIIPCPAGPHHIKIPDKIISGYDTVSHMVQNSLFNSSPKISTDTLVLKDTLHLPFISNVLEDQKAGALSQLGFYESNGSLFELFNSMKLDFTAITMLNLIVFLLIYYAMKKKDSL